MIKKLLTIVFAVFILSIIVGYIWLAKPYLSYEFVRLNELVEIPTVYAGWACGSNYPQLSPYEVKSNGERSLGDPFSLMLQEQLPNPEDSIAAVPGNKFVLWGYREKLITKNFITGVTTEKITPKVYLVGWKVITPYSVWDNAHQRIEHKEIYHMINNPNILSSHFRDVGHVGC